MFVGKARTYHIEEPFRYFTLGQVPGLAHNLPETNTLAFYENS
jgi:hypothetical protein